MASSSVPPKVKSTKPKTKAKGKAKPEPESPPEPTPQPLSAEYIADEAESGDGASDAADSDASSRSEEEEEQDSDEDLEAVTPRRKERNTAARAQTNGKSLSRYEPPVGMSELKATTAFVSSPFEWEALSSKPGVELWAIRAPRDLKPSRLSNLSLSVPRQSSSPVTGSMKYKSTSYTLSAAGSSKPAAFAVDAEGRQPTAGPGAVDAMTLDQPGTSEELRVEGGEEMEGLRLLVPRVKQGGKLFVAPVPITRRLLLTPDLPSAPAAGEPALPSFLSTSNVVIPASAPSVGGKRTQPTHLMKFRNEAYGFHTPGPGQTAGGARAMDVDSLLPLSQVASGTPGKEKKDKEKKEKRRKAEPGASPVKKKAKKSKE